MNPLQPGRCLLLLFAAALSCASHAQSGNVQELETYRLQLHEQFVSFRSTRRALYPAASIAFSIPSLKALSRLESKDIATKTCFKPAGDLPCSALDNLSQPPTVSDPLIYPIVLPVLISPSVSRAFPMNRQASGFSAKKPDSHCQG